MGEAVGEKSAKEAGEAAVADAKVDVLVTEVLASEKVSEPATSMAMDEVLMVGSSAARSSQQAEDKGTATARVDEDSCKFVLVSDHPSLTEQSERETKLKKEASRSEPVEKLLLGAPGTQTEKIVSAVGKKVLDVVSHSPERQRLIDAMELLTKDAAAVVKIAQV